MRKVIDYYKRVNGSGHIVEHIGTHESGDFLIGQLFEQSEKGYRAHPFDFLKEYDKIDKSEVDALDRQTCPERSLGGATTNTNIDFWKQDYDGKGFRKCSYCGSMHPEDALRLIKEHSTSIIEPATGKNYKWYVYGEKYYKWHNTPEFIKEYNTLLFTRKKS